jgi:hypothetical protein
MRSVIPISFSQLLSVGIRSSNSSKLLDQSDWILALAHILDDLPFPVTIISKEETEASLLLSLPMPTYVLSATVSTSANKKPMILYGNKSFVQMVGYTSVEIAQHSYDKYHCSNPLDLSSAALTSSPLSTISEAIDLGTFLKIGTMFYPQPPLAPFLNLQSYIPLYDPDGICHSILVFHCDLWRYSQHKEYFHKLHLLTEFLSKAIIPHRDHANTFLKAHFYHI